MLADGNDKQKGKERSGGDKPRTERPAPVVKVKPEPRVQTERREKIEKPQTSSPRVDTPEPERQTRIEVKPKGTAEARQPKTQVNPDARSGGQDRIRKTPDATRSGSATDKTNRSPGTGPNPRIQVRKPESGSGRGDNSVDPGKIKINIPQSETKVARPDDRSRDKSPSARPTDKSTRLKEGATLTRNDRDQIKHQLDQQERELIRQGKAAPPVKVKLPPQVKVAAAEKLQKLPRESLRVAVPKNGKLDPAVAARLKLQPAHETLKLRVQNGDFRHLANVKSAQKFQLHKQFDLHARGDVGRRMNLVAALELRGGWRHRHFGPISPVYSTHCRSMWYSGPSFCAPYVWYPTWSPWVDWCWWDTCAPLYDPRPVYCTPVVYSPCVPWVAWRFPTWQPLPYVTCGTWVDVDPVIINTGVDVQLLATRFVDPGHADQELGPRFRVWVRNNSRFDLNRDFNVLLIASTDANAYAGLPEAGVRVAGLRAGETQAIDIRLPYAANTLGRDSAGNAIPFTYLTALADSHNELSEEYEANNGATLIRGDILPVDPAAFAADPSSNQPNGIVHVAGEGLGPEPGQAMVLIGDQEFQAEILGWFDLGVQLRLPDFELDTATAADLVIIRGDGAASNPITIEIDPDSVHPQVSLAPEPRLPEPPPLPETAL